jgi:hypothetical protein
MNGRRAAVAVALVAAALGGCGGTADVATVGETAITHAQIVRLVEHGREDAGNEGASFPDKGSDGYRALERQALAILVTRAQITQAAGRLGIHVSDAEVTKQVAFPRKELVETLYEGARRQLGFPEENEKGTSAQLLADAVRVQLTLQRVQARVGAEGLGAWVERARELPVDYADGWQPDA